MFTSTSFNKIYKTVILISSKRHLKTNYTTVLSNRFHFSSDSSSSDKDFYDVVIAGGGMVGCSMACKLANDPAFHDMSILLLEGGPSKTIQKPKTDEKKTSRTYSNRVSALSKSSVKLLESVGAWEIIENLYGYCEVKEMRIWNSNKQKSDTSNILTFRNNDNLAFMVENDAILGALHSKILNDSKITVQYDSKVDQCYLPKQDTDLAVVKIANGKKMYKTSLLIGSDGFHSKVRSLINGQQYLSWEYGQRAVVANVQLQNTNSESNRNVAWQKFATLGPIALLPLDNQTCSIAWTTSNEEAQRLVQCTEDEFIKVLNSALLDEELNNTGSILADDINRIISTAINMCLLSSGSNDEEFKTSFVSPTVIGVTQNSRASFPLGFGHACRYVGQRVAIVGDAAHRIHPLAGQGVNLGFSDVIELSSQLKKSLLIGADIVGDTHALLNYESNAQACNIPIMLGIDMIQKTYGSNNPFIPSALLNFGRSLGLTVCQSATIFKRVLSHKASGLPA